MRCAACGYDVAIHVGGARCPLCQCGEATADHMAFSEPPAPSRAFAEALVEDGGRKKAKIKIIFRCPGKTTRLRAGTFSKPGPDGVPDWRAERYGDVLTPKACFPSGIEWRTIERVRLAESFAEAPEPPQVPARRARGPRELASYQGKQALGLGTLAAARGWSVEPWYWRASDGEEGCALILKRDPLRAVATWKRAAGKQGSASGWAADVAYGWAPGHFPTVLNHSNLEKVIENSGI